ncbi:MAG: choice-of-anchor D domain-containing protein [Flammeovirgaceae bacterium]|nr:choice-of-anchor D domain-containing protein [Flammeovirgaceae bacterium]
MLLLPVVGLRAKVVDHPVGALIQTLEVSIAGSPIISGSTQSFGNVDLLSTSSAITIVLKNIGGPEGLTINSVNLSGAHAADFNLDTSGLLNLLGPTASTSFTVSFSPTISGTRTALIEIDSDDPGVNPLVINLEGEGIKLNQSITFPAILAKIYGDASFPLGATTTSPLSVSYSSDNTLVATVSGNMVTIVGAGSANITASQVGDATFNTAADETQILLVDKATLTATANDQSRAYGAADPSLTINYAGFVNSETSIVLDTPPTTSTGAVATSVVGDYPINISGGSDDNYDFNYVPGTLTITKGLVTVNADSQSRVYGVANPTLTMSYSGFANGENSSVINSLPTLLR